MDVIALTVFGFFLLGFILYWRFRHRGKVESFLEHNQNVMPLFRERSAKIKYDIAVLIAIIYFEQVQFEIILQ